MSILDVLDTLESVDTAVQKVAMSPEMEETIKQKLKQEGRIGVYPNRYDVEFPFRVTVRKNKEFTEYGVFSNIEAASAIACLCGYAAYGSRALRGHYDRKIAEEHPEFTAWINDPANKEVINQTQIMAS